VKAGDLGVCEKNCGIDFGKCLITTGDFKTCLKDQASCALDCLKSVSASKNFANLRMWESARRTVPLITLNA